MLFRNGKNYGVDPYYGALIVFVVGEQPTAGVNKAQFENAVTWIKALDTNFDHNTLNILGPFASGSFASLQQLLGDPKNRPSGLEKSIKIVSGTASSGSAIDDFNKSMAGKLAWNSLVTFTGSTSLEIERYLRFLGIEGYDIKHVAVMSEDETEFGDDPNGHDYTFPGLILKYPRDIASLRTAYQREGLMESQQSRAEYAARQRLLSSDLADPAHETATDAIQTYSAGQADLSDEAELLQIVMQLRAHQSDFVLLICSNPFDQVFLARFLHSAFPQGRIVVVNSDELLFRERGSESLRGVLTLSPYPLSPEVQDWTIEGISPDRNIFTTQPAQGVYYALRTLLQSIRAKPRRRRRDHLQVSICRATRPLSG